jgi:hypothetical protein
MGGGLAEDAEGGQAVLCYAAMMSKLDEALEKLRALPKDRQEAVVRQLLQFIDHETDHDEFLTPEQWAELERRVAEPSTEYVEHDDVFKRLNARKT